MDRSFSHLHQFLLDPITPLVFTLELAESGDLTREAAIANTQTALVLLGNASQHFAAEQRKTLLQQLNLKLKRLVEDSDLSRRPSLVAWGRFQQGSQRQARRSRNSEESLHLKWVVQQAVFSGEPSLKRNFYKFMELGGVVVDTAPRTTTGHS